jgi:hypothetical protein
MTIQNSWCKDKTNFPSKLIISMWLQSGTPQKHIYQIAEKSSQQQFEGNMTMNPVLTLWELLTKYQTATFITNSSDSAVTTYWLHQLLKVGVDIHIMTCPSSGQVIVQNLHPKFLVHFQKQWEVSVMNSTKTCKVTKECSGQTKPNTTRSTVISLWVSPTKYQTISFIMNGGE